MRCNACKLANPLQHDVSSRTDPVFDLWAETPRDGRPGWMFGVGNYLPGSQDSPQNDGRIERPDDLGWRAVAKARFSTPRRRLGSAYLLETEAMQQRRQHSCMGDHIPAAARVTANPLCNRGSGC